MSSIEMRWKLKLFIPVETNNNINLLTIFSPDEKILSILLLCVAVQYVPYLETYLTGFCLYYACDFCAVDFVVLD